MKIAKELRDIFSGAEERYSRLALEVRDTLKTQVEDRGWFFISRVKGLESFALKVETGRVPDPSKMEDFFACTLVVPTIPQISQAEKFIEEHYKGEVRRPLADNMTKKVPSSFPFDDLRLYVSRAALPSGRNPDLEGLTFEIQIKTILQHAWSIATHDLIYKSDSISWPRERIAYQVKAMLEHAEVAISEANVLSNSPVIAKQDARSVDMSGILASLHATWENERLPTDVKRLAETVYDLMRMCDLQPVRLPEIVQAEVKRVGTLPTDLSPYSFIIQALAHTPDLDLRRRLERGRVKIVVHAGMDLPSWILGNHPKIVRLGSAGVTVSESTADIPLASAE